MIGIAWWLAVLGPAMAKTKQQRQEFFDASVAPLLNQEEQNNREAIERARQLLASDFGRYKNGVPGFIKDLNSWGTQYQITKAILNDYWNKSNEAPQIGRDKFAEDVVSDQELQHDVVAVIAQFSSDLEANRNILLSQLQENISTASIACASTDINSNNIEDAFRFENDSLLKQQAKLSPLVSALSAGGGFIAGDAVTKITEDIIIEMSTDITIESAADGSAVAAGALEGGAGGTVLEPGVGTAVGVVGGIAVGWVVSWWTEREFNEKVTNECDKILNEMNAFIWNDSKKGLASIFDECLTMNRTSHEIVLRKLIAGE